MGFQPATRVEALLDDLCRGYGYCLPPEEAAALVADPPQDVDTFIDAVLVAEGLSPSLCDKHTRLDLSELVRDWLFDGGRGKGSRSGLPLLPPSTGA
jgi:hypothetical protein